MLKKVQALLTELAPARLLRTTVIRIGCGGMVPCALLAAAKLQLDEVCAGMSASQPTAPPIIGRLATSQCEARLSALESQVRDMVVSLARIRSTQEVLALVCLLFGVWTLGWRLSMGAFGTKRGPVFLLPARW